MVVALVMSMTGEAAFSSPESRVEPTPSADQQASVNPEPPAGEFPDESSTGVPDGVTLTPTSGMTITQDGTVVDRRHVSGRIIIDADNVTVRNTLVESGTSLYPIHVKSGTSGTLIENVEVDSRGSQGIGIMLQGSGTVRYADVHSGEDGIRIQSDDVTIEYSYVHDLQRRSGGHHDSVQIRKGDDVTIRGNNLQAYVASTDDPMNASLQIGSLQGNDRISNLRVTGNLMNGGNFTINGGGRNEVDSALYSHNRFGRDYRYGPAGNIQNSTWENTNVWHDNGKPVRTPSFDPYPRRTPLAV